MRRLLINRHRIIGGLGLKVIFLDVDGVLNDNHTTEMCKDFVGIDKEKVQRLKKIVDSTGAIIVLTSDWKEGWMPNGQYLHSRYPFAEYLDSKLAEAGLHAFDKTKEAVSSQRGAGIIAWISMFPEITNYIVLDDEMFKDYRRYGIYPRHLILTDEDKGLTDNEVLTAVITLNGPEYR